MDVSLIIRECKAERDKIDVAIHTLEGLKEGSLSSRKPPVSASGNGQLVEIPRRKRGPRHMSASARKRISEMMKRRWAERRRNAA
jgi:hypothetical protein